MSYETRYAAMKRQQFSERGNTPEDVRERFAVVVWAQAAYADMLRAYPTLTAENFAVANAFRVERERELLRAAKGIEAEPSEPPHPPGGTSR